MDDFWECYLITEEEGIELDEKLHAEAADKESFAGMVLKDQKCLFVSEGSVDKETIAHELFHVVVDYFHISSADLDVSQFEEVVAVWIENNVDKFVKTRNKLYNKFKKLEGKK